MINYNNFQKEFEIIELNFGFEYPAKLVMMLFEKTKEISNEEFDEAVNKILSMDQESWQKLCGFGKKSPPIAEWINLFTGQKAQSPELKASLEVARILDFASYYFGNSVWFDNPITNACVDLYGGIQKVAWAIDSTNEKRSEKIWVEKELKEKWRICFDGKKEKHDACVGSSKPKIFQYKKGVFSIDDSGHRVEGIFLDNAPKISFVGDKSKYLAIEQKPKQEQRALPIPTIKKI